MDVGDLSIGVTGDWRSIQVITMLYLCFITFISILSMWPENTEDWRWSEEESTGKNRVNRRRWEGSIGRDCLIDQLITVHNKVDHLDERAKSSLGTWGHPIVQFHWNIRENIRHWKRLKWCVNQRPFQCFQITVSPFELLSSGSIGRLSHLRDWWFVEWQIWTNVEWKEENVETEYMDRMIRSIVVEWRAEGKCGTTESELLIGLEWMMMFNLSLDSM